MRLHGLLDHAGVFLAHDEQHTVRLARPYSLGGAEQHAGGELFHDRRLAHVVRPAEQDRAQSRVKVIDLFEPLGVEVRYRAQPVVVGLALLQFHAPPFQFRDMPHEFVGVPVGSHTLHARHGLSLRHDAHNLLTPFQSNGSNGWPLKSRGTPSPL